MDIDSGYYGAESCWMGPNQRDAEPESPTQFMGGVPLQFDDLRTGWPTDPPVSIARMRNKHLSKAESLFRVTDTLSEAGLSPLAV